ncbi:MAG: hypothetical protein KJN76_12060 [Eudoraea sp.]|nr:hypothetical protein [Eudoraea sp.]
MKKIICFSLIGFLLLACGTDEKKENSEGKEVDAKVAPVSEAMPSADYSTLLLEYSCDMDIAETAKVLGVSEVDLAIPDYATPDKCYYNLKGFGESVLGDGSSLMWGPLPSSKRQNKKEIAGYLEREKKNQNFMGMGIELAETGDCYLAYQPAQGRLIIYNEHYDQAFLINYGQKNANTDRTEEQHEALRKKMTDLANYLLKKHRK